MDKVPSTPPAPAQQRFDFETPSTPLIPQNGQFPTPQTLKTHSKRVLSTDIPSSGDHHNLLGTPETTPRKRQNDSAAKSLNHVLFPISHSTVGTGRRYSSNANQAYPNRTTGLLDLKSSIKVEIDEEEEEEEEEEGENEEELMNYSSSDEHSNIEIKRKLNLNSEKQQLQQQQQQQPCTPPNQIIDDKFIMNMNIETCHDSDDLEDVKNDINKSTPNLINPFLNDHHSKAINEESDLNPRFSNEIEMIYHSTGDHFWIPQDNLGLNIKPTNLINKLTNVIESPLNSKGFDMSNLLRTPKLQQDKSLMDDLNSTDEDEKDLIPQVIEQEEFETETINNLKSEIPNPFNSNTTKPPRTPRKLGVLRRVEYINQSSGDKREIDLNEDEMIKPKRLNFSGM